MGITLQRIVRRWESRFGESCDDGNHASENRATMLAGGEAEILRNCQAGKLDVRGKPDVHGENDARCKPATSIGPFLYHLCR